MSNLRKAAEMALAKLDHLWEIAVDERMGTDVLPEIKALRQALAQPEQEPVAWMNIEDNIFYKYEFKSCAESDKNAVPLYTAPPKREWVGLTPDEISELSEQAKKFCNDMFNTPDYDYFAGALWRAIEAKLKEKNT